MTSAKYYREMSEHYAAKAEHMRIIAQSMERSNARKEATFRAEQYNELSQVYWENSMSVDAPVVPLITRCLFEDESRN